MSPTAWSYDGTARIFTCRITGTVHPPEGGIHLTERASILASTSSGSVVLIQRERHTSLETMVVLVVVHITQVQRSVR